MNKIFFLSIIILLASTGCKNDPKLFNTSGNALGTTYAVLYIAPSKLETFDKGLDSIFKAVNKSMSTYISSSDISKINNGDASVKVDAMFKKVFNLSKDIYEVTNGSFDPTVGNLVNVWGFGPKMGMQTIAPKTIDSLMQYVGFNKVNLTKEGTIAKQHPEIYLDFNAIAKGYTLDRIATYLNENQIDNYLIELGGELVAKGIRTDKNSEWVVGIDNPKQTNERTLITTLKLKDRAMATSGNYRKFRIDTITGKKYVHTVDALTGYTKDSSILSTSVIADNCAIADGYATAFMAMSLKKTKAILKNKQLDAYIIYSDTLGNLQSYVTPGFKERLNP